jgi:hypothetical protein
MTADDQRAVISYCAGVMHGNLYRLRKLVNDGDFDEIGPVVEEVLRVVEWHMFKEGARPGAAGPDGAEEGGE